MTVTADILLSTRTQPILSPFRYPGGKTWLIPYIRKWIKSQGRPDTFVEPFAGGASVSLSVANENLAGRIFITELDSAVAAVWETIINTNTGAAWLAEKINNFNFNRSAVISELNRMGLKGRALAFQAILRNRVSRGGILSVGAGLLRKGENGNGIGSRWYPDTLQKRILGIAGLRNKIAFQKCDGLQALRDRTRNTNSLFFLDPPYTIGKKKAGLRLYEHSDIDPEELFEITSRLRSDFLMTYNDSILIRRLASEHGFEVCTIMMRSTHHKKVRELLIGRNLGWRSGGESPSKQ